jgi:hypothetical protein
MIAWNDRRKAKKAARATTRLQIQQMAKTGAIKALTPPSKDKYEAQRQKADNKQERADVLQSASRARSEYNYRAETAGSPKRMSKGESIKDAARFNDMKRKQEGK